MNLKPEHTHNGLQVRTAGGTTYIGRTPSEIKAATREAEVRREAITTVNDRLICRACMVALPYVKTAWSSVPGDCQTTGCIHGPKEVRS